MTLNDIRLTLYRYFLSPLHRGKELSAVCQAIGHGRIEIVIRDGKLVAVNAFANQIEDKEMERMIAEQIAKTSKVAA